VFFFFFFLLGWLLGSFFFFFFFFVLCFGPFTLQDNAAEKRAPLSHDFFPLDITLVAFASPNSVLLGAPTGALCSPLQLH